MSKKDGGFEAKISAATLRVAATHGWDKLTMEHIATAAKIPVTQLVKQYATKVDILPALVRTITAETMATVGDVQQGAMRDRIFEILMGRFDVLQKHRQAILGIMHESKCNPAAARVLLSAQHQAIRDMLIGVNIEQTGLRWLVVVAGVWGIYGATAAVWTRDESVDMSKTMAALDRYLRRADKSMEIIARFVR